MTLAGSQKSPSPGSLLLLDVAQLHQFIHDGIDGQAACAMDLQLAGDVPSVGHDRMGREEKPVGNLPVGHTATIGS